MGCGRGERIDWGWVGENRTLLKTGGCGTGLGGIEVGWSRIDRRLERSKRGRLIIGFPCLQPAVDFGGVAVPGAELGYGGGGLADAGAECGVGVEGAEDGGQRG
jgi:hypothetical protein